jgi:hypothetical protein
MSMMLPRRLRPFGIGIELVVLGLVIAIAIVSLF